MRLVSLEKWNSVFGAAAEEALTTFSIWYPIVKRRGQSIYLVIDLAIFDDPIDLFQFDPLMIDRSFEIYPLFRDTEIDPDFLMTFIDLCEDEFGYSPVNASGYFALEFNDIRDYYGVTFEEDMAAKYTSYPSFKKWMDVADE